MSKVTLLSDFRCDGKSYPPNKPVEMETEHLKIAKANGLVKDADEAKAEAEAKAKAEAEAKAKAEAEANKSKGNAPANKAKGK